MAMVEPTLRRFRRGETTFEDFVAIVPDGQKADLLDGVIYVASPDNLRNNELNAWLVTVIDAYVHERDLGAVYVSRVAYRISAKRGPEPDVSFVSKEHLDRKRIGHVAGPPDFVIEIVSPDSVSRDYELKRQIYEEAGVPEYWILDPDESYGLFLRLKDGTYVEVQPDENHRIHSEVIDGFWLDARWLFDPKRPTPHSVVKQLLGEQ